MFRKQFHDNWRLIVIILLLISIILASGLVFAQIVDIPPARLIRDPLQIAGIPSYDGSISNLGILGWMSATTTCLFTYTLVRKTNTLDARFYLASGLFTSILLVDDFFVIHESANKVIYQLTETPFAIFYIVLLGIYLLFFYRRILESQYIMLGLALVALGASQCMDTFWHYETESILAFIEDSLKFTGICFWAAYFINAAYQTIKPNINATTSK